MIATARKSLDEALDELENLKLLGVVDVAKLTTFSDAMIRRCTAPRGPLVCVRVRSGVTIPRKDGKVPGPPRYVVKYRPADVARWIESMVVEPALLQPEPPA